MRTVTVELTNEKALKVLQDLEEKHFIRIIGQSDKDSPALPGKPLTAKEFKDLLLSRENGPTVSLKEAKAEWAKQRKQLQKLVK